MYAFFDVSATAATIYFCGTPKTSMCHRPFFRNPFISSSHLQRNSNVDIRAVTSVQMFGSPSSVPEMTLHLARLALVIVPSNQPPAEVSGAQKAGKALDKTSIKLLYRRIELRTMCLAADLVETARRAALPSPTLESRPGDEIRLRVGPTSR